MLIGSREHALRWIAETNKTADCTFDLISESWHRLSLSEPLLTKQLSAITGYTYPDCSELWSAIPAFLLDQDNFRSQPEKQVDEHSKLIYRARGRVLCILPSNAIIPLLPILSACSLAANCKTVFTSPSPIRPLARSIAECLEFTEAAFFLDESPRGIVSSPDLSAFDHVYYIGSSKAYPDVAKACASNGISLTFEGQGKSAVILSPSCNQSCIDEACKSIVESLAFCNGAMCSTPNHVVAHNSIIDYASERLLHYSNKANLNASLSSLLHISTETRKIAAKEAEVDFDSMFHPLFVPASLETPFDYDELYGPAAWFSEYQTFDEVMSIMNFKKSYGLQVCYFGHDSEEMERISNASMGRVLINEKPCFQNPCRPWGNYGMSGYSRTETFYQKFLIPILVETGMVGALGFEPR